jgi:hypothetical protein
MPKQIESSDPGDFRGVSPPPMPLPPIGARYMVDRPADLVIMAHALADSPMLAIDAEFVSARPGVAHQTPRLALIQIADAAVPQCFVVDALRLPDLAPLDEFFDHPGIVKIFHGVGSDLRVLGARGVQVTHTVDIEAVSRSLFGSRESGLQAMMLRACNAQLDKTLQRSDWTQRPLTPAMFAYAARDAEMTLALAQWLGEHYRWAMDLYEERPDDRMPEDVAAPWLASFIAGDRSFSPEFIEAVDVVALARECQEALAIVTKPAWRARILRAAADLVLPDVIPQALASLRARTGEERAAAARALGRLRAIDTQGALEAALNDPVGDVRRAAVTALEQLPLPPRSLRFPRGDAAATETSDEGDADAPWKAALRGLLPPDDGPTE